MGIQEKLFRAAAVEQDKQHGNQGHLCKEKKSLTALIGYVPAWTVEKCFVECFVDM